MAQIDLIGSYGWEWLLGAARALPPDLLWAIIGSIGIVCLIALVFLSRARRKKRVLEYRLAIVTRQLAGIRDERVALDIELSRLRTELAHMDEEFSRVSTELDRADRELAALESKQPKACGLSAGEMNFLKIAEAAIAHSGAKVPRPF